jgi:release factor glutamine methyltransferase
MLRQALDQARQRLAAAGNIENPSLESEVLLKYYLKTDKVYLYLEPQKVLEKAVETAFFQGVERLLQGEPLAYIIQSREFFGLDFYVDERVLIPRPETELVVEEALRFIQSQPVAALADIGTGSGAIAVSLAINLLHSPAQNPASQPENPSVQHSVLLPTIYATDISAAALEVAAINCRKHGLSGVITLLQGDLLGPLPGAVDLLIANLPYVRREDTAAMPSARFEPLLALDGGESGLESIKRLCGALEGKIKPSGCILLEIGLGQGEAVTALLRDRFPAAKIEVLPDLAGIGRVVRVEHLV